MNAQIKYLEGSFALAHKNRADFLFLLRLKAHYSQGYVNESLGQIGQRVGESRNTVLNRLRGCERLGWTTKYTKEGKHTYKLISYDDLYVSLGYELKANGVGFKNCHSFYKIQLEKCTDKKQLLLLIHGYDHQRRLQRMQIESERSEAPSAILPLSCEGSANIAGYKSATKGWQIQKQLEAAGLINIKRTLECKGRMHIREYWKKKNFSSVFNNCRFVLQEKGFGFVIERKCNLVGIGSILPLLPDYLQNHQGKDFSLKAKAMLGF